MSGGYYYIYQHVPKCGGTSFRSACGHFFTGIHEIPPAREDVEAWGAFLRNKVDFSTLAPDTMISGHLIHNGVRPRERYAEEIARGGVRILTVLRDPMARLISGYMYATQRGKKLPPLEDRLRKAENPISRYLGFDGGDPVSYLESFFLVGITEHLQDTIDLLAASLGRSSVEVPKENVTVERKKPEVTPETAEKFLEKNKRDYALYNAGLEIFRRRCKSELNRSV